MGFFFKHWGIIIIVAVVWSPFVSCNEETVAITIEGIPQVGETLTASSSGKGFSSKDSYTWYSASSGNDSWGSHIATNSDSSRTLIIPESCLDKYIYAERRNSSDSTTIRSHAIGPILQSNNYPEVTISGTAKVGETITATSTGDGFSDLHGYEWYTSSTASASGYGSKITNPGPDINKLIVPKNCAGSYIYAQRYNEPKDKYIKSSTIGPIAAQ